MGAGAPEGNQNSKIENRLWRNTINRAIAQGDPDRLRRIAERLLAKAEEGDLGALKELGDRLDGKAVAAMEVSGPNGDPIPTEIKVTLVSPQSGSNG